MTNHNLQRLNAEHTARYGKRSTPTIQTFSLLDCELEKLYEGSKEHEAYKTKDKSKYIWDEHFAKKHP